MYDSMNQETVACLRSEILRCIKNLLETKHLYQSVRIDTSIVGKMINEAENSSEMQRQIKIIVSRSKVAQGTSPFSSQSIINQNLNKYRKNIQDTANAILYNFWSFSTDECDQLIRAKGDKLADNPTHFTLPTISVACTHCGATLPAHNSGFRGLKEDIQTISFPDFSNKEQPLQTFVFPYQCQSCKKEPLIFLVHRKGNKLTLVGRNHFETVYVPKAIPDQESAYFSDAIVAYNTGNVLAGLFLLRVTIEQYMRRVLGTFQKISGDELASQYASYLDDEFPTKFPSLKKIYEELSVFLHSADKKEVQFVKSKNDIIKHFELIQHLPLKEK